MDFYLPKYSAYIEYDGRQHYEPVKIWGGEDTLKGVIFRDGIKDAYCKLQWIPLLRIPYWDFDNIERIVTNFVTDLETKRQKRKEDMEKHDE